MTHRLASTMHRMIELEQDLMTFFDDGAWAHRDPADPDNCDFVAGNPQEMALPEYVASLLKWTEPQDKDWYAYKFNEGYATEAVAAVLRHRRDVPFEADDILMTDGAFTGLNLCMRTVTDPGDEVIFLSPPWFFYEAMIVGTGAEPVRVRVNQETWDLDLDAIATAITDRTSCIIVNSPNNPTGKIYPPETLTELARILSAASQVHGRPIYLISDEAYSRIVYDDRPYPSPTEFYPYSFLVYTYAKQLLTPGQRCGYIALPPTMPDREEMREALAIAQLTHGGHGAPSNVLQRAIEDIEPMSVNIGALQRRRDRMVEALTSYGYTLHAPEGTFYLLPTSPIPDDVAFVERLAQDKVFVLPGKVVEMPGRFRISITGNDDMVERALPVFERAAKEA